MHSPNSFPSRSDGQPRTGQRRGHGLDVSTCRLSILLGRILIATPSRLHLPEIHSRAFSSVWRVSHFPTFFELCIHFFQLTFILFSNRLSGVASFVLGLALFLISVAAAWFLSRPLLVLSLVGTGVALWTTFGTPEMHEAWVLPAWIGVMVLVHGGIAGWNFYIKDDPERTPLLA
jgi:hypothetical protein